MITNIACPPPLLDSICFWERGLDPWHREAFSAIKEIYDSLPSTTKKRKSGWNGIDFCGNPIGFIPDGTEIEVYNDTYILGESYNGTLCAVRPNFIEQFKITYERKI